MRMVRLRGENAGFAAPSLCELRRVVDLRGCAPAGARDLEQRVQRLVDPGARHDHCVAPAVSFLADAEESTADIFAVIENQELVLHLELAARDDLLVNHFGRSGEKSRGLCHSPPGVKSGIFADARFAHIRI